MDHGYTNLKWERIMAIDGQTLDEVKVYWKRYRRQVFFTVAAMQIFILLVVGCLIAYFNLLSTQRITETVILIVAGSTLLFANIALVFYIVKPLKTLSDAILHIAGINNGSTLPNPNNSRNKATHLSSLLKVLYDRPSEAGVSKDISNDSVHSSQAMVDDVAAGIIAFDHEGKVVFNNKTAPIREAKEGGVELELEFYNEESLTEWFKKCEENTVRADKVWERVASIPAGQPDRKLFDVVASYRKGNDLPLVAFFIDRTNDYNNEEDDLNFIAFAAHELRGPITVIKGYLDTLMDEMGDGLTDEQHQLFDRLVVSSNRLSAYINNILNAARFDQRHLRLNLVEVSLADIYNEVADDMSLRASSQHRILNVNIPATLPAVAADIASASEVISNLIDNALKYSNEGGVVNVSAQVKDGFIETVVKDNGIGMPANVVSNLFHKFYRSHRSRETVAGTGIGLYISKGIIESHGGTIEVRSVEGEGSTFSFTLPIYATVAEKLGAQRGDNAELIKSHKSGWIRNHGEIRG